MKLFSPKIDRYVIIIMYVPIKSVLANSKTTVAQTLFNLKT